MITILSNNRPRSGRGRAVGWQDAGCKPALANAYQAQDTGQSGSPNLESANMSNPRKKNLRVANPQGLTMRKILTTLLLLCGGLISIAQTIVFDGIEPSENSTISKAEFVLKFDFTNVIENLGGTNADWGICCNSDQALIFPSNEKSATLYKGTPSEGEMLEKQFVTIRPTSDDFSNTSTFNISFPSVEIDPGQIYTLVVTYDMYAGKVGETTWTTSTKYSFKSNPLTVSFIGADNVSKVPQILSSSIPDDKEVSSISDIDLKFNYDLKLSDNPIVGLYENGSLISNATNVVLSDIDSSIIKITLDETPLYYSHNYELVIKANSIGIEGESDLYGSDISMTFTGASYHMFGQKSVLPRPNMPTLLEEIQVNFDFPEGYGFVYVDNETQYPMNVYKGEPIEANLLGSVNYDAITSDSRGLIYHPDLDFEVDNTYTFVLDEDVVKAYEIGAARPTYLKDYKCRRIELSFKTPEASTISKVTFTPQTEPLEMATLEDRFTIPVDAYTFGGVEYDLKGANGKYISLYEISNNGVERKIGNYDFGYLKTTDGQRRLVLLGGNTDAPVGFALDDDKEYRFDIPANYLTANQKMLKDHSGNEPFSYFIKGTSATSFYVSYSLAEVGTLRTPVSVGKTVTVDLTGTEDWKVSAVLFNGETVETEGDTYTTPAIESDATIEVEYEYAHEIDYNFTTGVDMTEICPYGVVSEGENLIISGVQSGDAIAIYTTGGLKVADLPTVPQNMDRVAVSLPTGQAYIILINGKSLKFLHQ